MKALQIKERGLFVVKAARVLASMQHEQQREGLSAHWDELAGRVPCLAAAGVAGDAR